MQKAKDADEPFFVWLNTSRMHLYTRLNDKWRYAAEKYTSDADLHGSGMLQHDHDIGIVLDWLKESGLEEDTIVWYSTDNVLGHEGKRDLVNRSLCAGIERRGMHSEPDGFHRQRDRSLP